MYLLDTDILSNLMKRAPSSALVAKVARVPPEHQFTSSITLGELVYRAHRLRERAAVLLERIEDALLPNLPVPPSTPLQPGATGRFGPKWSGLQIPQFRRKPELRFHGLLTEGATWQVELARA
jgi:hypothetical protein